MAMLDASGAVQLQAASPLPSATSAAAVGSGEGVSGAWTAQAARFGGAAALLLGGGLLLAPVATLGAVFHARRVKAAPCAEKCHARLCRPGCCWGPRRRWTQHSTAVVAQGPVCEVSSARLSSDLLATQRCCYCSPGCCWRLCSTACGIPGKLGKQPRVTTAWKLCANLVSRHDERVFVFLMPGSDLGRTAALHQ